MTDEFQSDDVTSSGVIIGFISAVQGTQPTKYFVINFNEYFLAFSDVNKAEIEEHLDFVKEITEFKKAVLDCLICRFTSAPGSSSNRKIVTVDVLNNKNFILASLLDPRIKLVIFKGNIVFTFLNKELARSHNIMCFFRWR